MYFFNPYEEFIKDDMEIDLHTVLHEMRCINYNNTSSYNPGFNREGADFILNIIKPEYKSNNLIKLIKLAVRMSIERHHLCAFRIYDSNNSKYGCICEITNGNIFLHLVYPYTSIFSNEELNEIKALSMELKLSK